MSKSIEQLRAKCIGNAHSINCIYSACGKRIDLHTNRDGTFTIMTYYVYGDSWSASATGRNVTPDKLGVALAKTMIDFVGQWISRDNVDSYSYSVGAKFTVQEPKRLSERFLLGGPTL